MRSSDEINENIIAAHKRNDLNNLALLYKSLGMYELEKSNIDAGCFFLTNAYTYALERIASQVQAVFNVIKSTPIWVKENKSHYKPRAKQPVYKQAVQKIMQSSHELYDELKQNHEFERRLVLMIEERKLLMEKASPAQAQKLNQEILTTHARLGRCRKAISATEDKIQQVEKQQLR